MKLHFEQIGQQGYQFSLEGKNFTLQEDGLRVELAGSLTLRCSSAAEDGVVVQGELEGAFTGQCAYCAVGVPFSFKRDVFCQFVVGEESLDSEVEIKCDNEQLHTSFLSAPEIDLEELLQEQIYLSIPMQLVCSSGCKGVCAGCGADLNSEQCSCDEIPSSSPFAVLSKLKK